MSTIDDRVVSMRFENSKFAAGVNGTLALLDKLKNSLKFSATKNGVDDVQKSVDSFHMGHMGDAADKVGLRFSALQVAAVTAISNITNRALNAGINIAKSFTIAPIAAGFANYETQINAVQTILANTGLKGKAGLGQVNKALDELNTYANKTVYNFSEMARNIGTFTAAGVKLGPATAAIKGIANLAALSGSNSEQASTAMYQLSQAIAANKVGLQDWNSVVNAGLGGKVFQTALFETGKHLGTIKGVKMNETFAQWTAAGNTFRGSLKDGWITGKVLTDTLSHFTGDLSAAQLKSQGYNATQIKQIREMASTANAAAVNIKTYTQLKDALKEEVASAYSNVFKTLFGDINGATTLFSKLHTVAENALTSPINNFNKFLQKVKGLGGIRILFDSIKNIFKAVNAILTPIKKAFSDIFPPRTAAQVVEMIKHFHAFTQGLIVSKDTADKIRHVFRGLFAIFDIGKQIISGIFGVFKNLFHVATEGSGGILTFAARVGDFFTRLDKSIKNGTGLTTFFTVLTRVLAAPIKLLTVFRNVVVGFFNGVSGKDVNGITSAFHKMGDSLGHLGTVGDKFQKVWQKVVDKFDKFKQAIKPITDAVRNFFHSLTTSIANSFSGPNITKTLSLLQTGLLGGIFLALKKFKGGLHVDLGGGLLHSVRESFEGLTGSMKAMQAQVKSNAILKIAIAIGILTASLLVLSTINGKKLADSLKAMGVAFAELLGAMAVLTKISGGVGVLKLPVIAAGLILLSSAILILVLAVKALSSMDWQSLIKGLVGVGVLLASISVAGIVLSKSSGGLATAGVGMIALAVAIRILANAVAAMAKLSWGDMIKGLTGVALAMIAIAGAVRLMPPNMAAAGAGLFVLSIALRALAGAITSFAGINWQTMAKGLGAIAATIVSIGLAMRLMPRDMIAQAIALGILSLALRGFAAVIAKMGAFSWTVIAKGLITLAAALGIIAGALRLMSGTLAGSAALLVATLALRGIVTVIKTLGSMSIASIITALVAMAAALGILGGAAYLMLPLAPGLVALTLAFFGFGAALALVGVAVIAMGEGFKLIAEGGAKAVSILLTAFGGLIKQLPALLMGLANALVGFVITIGKNAPRMIGAFARIMTALIDAVIRILPRMAVLIGRLVDTILSVLIRNLPRIANAGFRLIVTLLNSLANNLPRIVHAGANVVIAFLEGLGNDIGRLVNAGFRFIVKFMHGIASGIRNHMGEILRAAGDIGKALIEGIWNGIKGLAGWLWSKVTGFFGSIWNGIKDIFGISSPSKLMHWAGQMIMIGFGNGIDANAHIAKQSMVNMGNALIDEARRTIKRVPNELNGIVNVNPKITPVLDLTHVKEGAGQIGQWLSVAPVHADVSFNRAKSISADQLDARAGASTVAASSAPTKIEINQTNNSPKALDVGEIYRNTKSIVSIAKEALNTP